MQVIITGKGIELTEAIKAYVDEKIGSLDKFYDRILRAEVNVGKENHHHLKGYVFVCECKLDVPGKDLFAEKKEKTLYKAIDKVRDYLENEIKKHKTLLTEKTSADRVKVRESKGYTIEE